MDFWTITTLFPHFNPFLIHLYSLQDTNLPVDGFCQHQDSLKCKPSHPQCWQNGRPPRCRSSTSSSRRAASPGTPLQVRHLDQFKLDHLAHRSRIWSATTTAPARLLPGVRRRRRGGQPGCLHRLQPVQHVRAVCGRRLPLGGWR